MKPKQVDDLWTETYILALVPTRARKKPYEYLAGLVDSLSMKHRELTEMVKFIKTNRDLKVRAFRASLLQSEALVRHTEEEYAVTIGVLEREAQSVQYTVEHARRMLKNAGYHQDGRGWHAIRK